MNPRPKLPNPMPRPLRNRAIACVILGSLTGMVAFQSLGKAIETDRQKIDERVSEDENMRRMAEAQSLAEYNAISSMRVIRGIVSGLLALASSLVVVSAIRIVRPFGMPRASAATLLGRAALGAAILRTLAGAQDTVIAQRIGAATAKVPATDELAAVSGAWVPLMMTIAVVMTLVLAGGLLVLSHYFRSEKVKQLVAFIDRQTQPS